MQINSTCHTREPIGLMNELFRVSGKFKEIKDVFEIYDVYDWQFKYPVRCTKFMTKVKKWTMLGI